MFRNNPLKSWLSTSSLMLLAGPAAGQLVEGAYGVPLEDLRRGELPPHWTVTAPPGGLAPHVLQRPYSPCSLDPLTETVFENEPWPNGIVPYEFDANVSAAQQTTALSAMGDIQAVADIVFVPVTNEPGFLHIQDDTINQSSSIGYTPNQVTIRISNWNIYGTVQHEFLHAIGFPHEHVRPDRDTFIAIVFANIVMGAVGNFDPPTATGITAGPYDFSSVMHYGKCAFTTCPSPNQQTCASGCETILMQPAYTAFQNVIGQRIFMSPLDIHGVRSLYPYGHWRFVDPSNPAPGTGTGIDPWQELYVARSQAPAGATVFAMPGNYPSTGAVWDTAMVIRAPVGGVVMQ